MTHTLLFSISVESMHCMSQNPLSPLDSLCYSPIPILTSLLFSYQIIPTLLFSNFNILSHFDSLYCSDVKLLLLYCFPFQISSVLLFHLCLGIPYCSFCHCSPLEFEITKNLYKPPNFPPLQAERLLPQPPPSPPQLFYRYYSV
jgi:hypothetical protein